MNEALRLADALDDTPNWQKESFGSNWKSSTMKFDRTPFEAAAELRRLHALNAELVEALKWIGDHDLKGCDLVVAGHMAHGFIGRARAALAKVEASK